jgi:hypothetical protein
MATSNGIAQQETRLSREEAWHAVEAEILEEINRLRRDPARYAKEVLRPLKQRRLRVPKDKSKRFEAYRFFVSDRATDDIEVREGDSEEAALAVIDEAIEALEDTSQLPKLCRNAALDQAARFFSRDFQSGGIKRPPHVDSLGRRPAARLASFGATKNAIKEWDQFSKGLGEKSEATIRVFQKEEDYYLVELPKSGGYKYWYVPDAFGDFVAKHGKEVMIPKLGKPGYEAIVRVDRQRRTLHKHEDSIAYPLRMPTHGENIAWGAWSQQGAARGMVCWWLIDPGIQSRGHRQILLTPEFRYCGIGCLWSRRTGWIATFDAAAEPLKPYVE